MNYILFTIIYMYNEQNMKNEKMYIKHGLVQVRMKEVSLD